MKSHKLLLSVLALVAFAAAPVLRAEDAPATPHAGAPEHKGPRFDRLKELTERLGLTDEQVAKIKPIIADEMAAVKALRQDTAVDKEAKKVKFMEIHKAHVEQMLPILTAEQQAKLKAGREKRKEKGGEALAPKSGPAL